MLLFDRVLHQGYLPPPVISLVKLWRELLADRQRMGPTRKYMSWPRVFHLRRTPSPNTGPGANLSFCRRSFSLSSCLSLISYTAVSDRRTLATVAASIYFSL